MNGSRNHEHPGYEWSFSRAYNECKPIYIPVGLAAI